MKLPSRIVSIFVLPVCLVCTAGRLAAQTDAPADPSWYSGSVLEFLLGTAVVLLVLQLLRKVRKQKRLAGELRERNAMIEEKRRRGEQLLLNILPQAVAAELAFRNAVAARRYESATVMFVDFVGFTHVAEQLSPEELVAQLHHCFSSFDNLLGRRRLEKIKTSGDAYICASGLSDRNEHPADMLRFALQIQAFMQQYKSERQAVNKPYFEARIGIHFGPVVAGMVGVKKFAYDIWGDTVNLAARMEEASEAGRINISESVYERVKTEFTCTPRGRISAKNKGEVEMYFVEA